MNHRFAIKKTAFGVSTLLCFLTHQSEVRPDEWAFSLDRRMTIKKNQWKTFHKVAGFTNVAVAAGLKLVGINGSSWKCAAIPHVRNYLFRCINVDSWKGAVDLETEWH